MYEVRGEQWPSSNAEGTVQGSLKVYCLGEEGKYPIFNVKKGSKEEERYLTDR